MLALKSRRGQAWSPSSPDLNPCDFWAWGYLKSKVYKPMPRNIEDLKQQIVQECNNIPKEMVKKTVVTMKARAALVVQSDGRAIDD